MTYYLFNVFFREMAKDSLNLPSSKKRINAQFTINKQGNISNIKARDSHPQLEAEVMSSEIITAIYSRKT